jgi:hypothetical protein
MCQAAAPVGFPNRAPNYAGADRYIVRSYMPNKDSTVAGSWALRAQVIHDRLARLLGQWKDAAATQLTHREMDGSFFPIHAIQLQLDNLGCA